MFQGKEEVIRGLSQKFDTYLVCVGWYNETASPSLGLSKDTVARLANMGMAIDSDLYFLGERTAP
ncbi:MAG: hypothetical protein NVS3B3_15730 [Aquirhabdus sp.]